MWCVLRVCLLWFRLCLFVGDDFDMFDWVCVCDFVCFVCGMCLVYVRGSVCVVRLVFRECVVCIYVCVFVYMCV